MQVVAYFLQVEQAEEFDKAHERQKGGKKESQPENRLVVHQIEGVVGNAELRAQFETPAIKKTQLITS